MPLKVKICGLINKDSVITSINGGASYCGFILNYPKSHRYIYDISKILYLNKINRKKCKLVAVLVNPTNADLNKLKSINFDYFQLHGEESAERIKEIKINHKIKIIKTIKIKKKNDINNYLQYQNIVDLFLFDSYGFEKSKKFNHSWLKSLSDSNIHWMLAGKIGIDNLEKVAKIAKIIDVSGSLEVNKKKDNKKITNFLNKVKKINYENKKKYSPN